jgi:hypothetical protein
VPEDWTARLAAAIAAALSDFAARPSAEAVAMLAVDCHPWHGSLALALLTTAEAETDPLLADPAEMAAWRYYDFARDLPCWQSVAQLGAEMRAAYDAGERPAVAIAFLRACTAAVLSPQAGAALRRLSQARGFRLSVAHPDNGQEFVPAG